MDPRLSADVPEFQPSRYYQSNANWSKSLFSSRDSYQSTNGICVQLDSNLSPWVAEFVPRYNTSQRHGRGGKWQKTANTNGERPNFPSANTLKSKKDKSTTDELSCSKGNALFANERGNVSGLSALSCASRSCEEDTARDNTDEGSINHQQQKQRRHHRRSNKKKLKEIRVEDGLSAIKASTTPKNSTTVIQDSHKENEASVLLEPNCGKSEVKTESREKAPMQHSWSNLFKIPVTAPNPVSKGRGVKSPPEIINKKVASAKAMSYSGNFEQLPMTSSTTVSKPTLKNYKMGEIFKQSSSSNILAGVGRGSCFTLNGDIVLKRSPSRSKKMEESAIFQSFVPTSRKTEKPFLVPKQVDRPCSEPLNSPSVKTSRRDHLKKQSALGACSVAGPTCSGDKEESLNNKKEKALQAMVKGLINITVAQDLVHLRNGAQKRPQSKGFDERGYIKLHGGKTVSDTACVEVNNSSDMVSGQKDIECETNEEKRPNIKKEEDWPGLGNVVKHTSVVLSYSEILKRKAEGTLNNTMIHQPLLPSQSQQADISDKEWQEMRRKKKKEKRKQKKKEKKIAVRVQKEKLGLLPKQSEPAQRLTETPVTLDFGNLFEKMLPSTTLAANAPSSQKKSNKRRSLLSIGVVSVAPGVAKKNTRDGKKKDMSRVSVNMLDSTQPVRMRGKEREKPRKKKLTLLRKIILKEREAKRKAREEASAMDKDLGAEEAEENSVQADGDFCEDQKDQESMEVLGENLNPKSIALLSDLPDAVIKRLHSRKFREYCDHFVTKEIGLHASELLWDLQRFQNRAYQESPIKGKAKRRLVSGLREISRHVKLKRLKCVLVASNLERIAVEGGIDDYLSRIISTCKEYRVPLVFPMSRQGLGRVLRKKVPVSAVGIFSYDGAQEKFKALMELVETERQSYALKAEELVSSELNGSAKEDSHDGVVKLKSRRKKRSGNKKKLSRQRMNALQLFDVNHVEFAEAAELNSRDLDSFSVSPISSPFYPPPSVFYN